MLEAYFGSRAEVRCFYDIFETDFVVPEEGARVVVEAFAESYSVDIQEVHLLYNIKVTENDLVRLFLTDR
jgi:hypothetical protein